MSKRESIYFSHDADAMNDPKCMLLISQMGMEGYGAFWALVELLRVQPEFKMSLALIPAIAARLQITEAKLKTVISAFGLFLVTDDSFFFSQSLRDRMQLMVKQKEDRKMWAIKAANARWGNGNSLNNIELCVSNANALQEHCKSNADLCQRKEKKGKESIKKEPKGSKEKATAFRPPQLSEIVNYCKERANDVDASRFFNFYLAKGWMVGRNKMKDWKAAVRSWEKEDNSKNQQSHENSNQYSKL